MFTIGDTRDTVHCQGRSRRDFLWIAEIRRRHLVHHRIGAVAEHTFRTDIEALIGWPEPRAIDRRRIVGRHELADVSLYDIDAGGVSEAFQEPLECRRGPKIVSIEKRDELPPSVCDSLIARC